MLGWGLHPHPMITVTETRLGDDRPSGRIGARPEGCNPYPIFIVQFYFLNAFWEIAFA